MKGYNIIFFTENIQIINDIQDKNIPMPNHIAYAYNINGMSGAWIQYNIEGNPTAGKALQFKVDIQKRFCKTFKCKSADDMPIAKDTLVNAAHNLSDFDNLESIGSYDMTTFYRTLNLTLPDNKRGLFDFVRKTANKLIINNKCKKISNEITKDELISAVDANYLGKIQKKERKHIINNVFKWYQEKGFTTRKPSVRNKEEHTYYMHEEIKRKNKKLILDELVKQYTKSKTFNLSLVSREINKSVKTVRKYFRLFFSELKSLIVSSLNSGLSFFREVACVVLSPLRHLSFPDNPTKIQEINTNIEKRVKLSKKYADIQKE